MRRRPWLWPALALAFAVLRGAPMLHAQALADSVGSVSFRVVPETVTVGQPFMVNLRAIPVTGRTAVAPAVPDTGGIVEPLDPAQLSRRGDTLVARYRLIAWQPGVLTIPLAPVQMRRGASEVSVPLDIRVVVASVLPLDSASRVPKSPRALFPAAAPWWEGWWRWLAALLGCLVAVYLWHRWRTRERKVVGDRLSPLEQAEAAFARLDARGLPALGEGGRHVTLVTEIVRRYLADIEPSLPITLTNAELLAAARDNAAMPVTRLVTLLEQTDQVRFSGMRTDAETVRRVSGLAREIVRDVERLRSAPDTVAA